MDASSRSEVTEISKADIPADTFAVPDGYRRRSRRCRSDAGRRRGKPSRRRGAEPLDRVGLEHVHPGSLRRPHAAIARATVRAWTGRYRARAPRSSGEARRSASSPAARRPAARALAEQQRRPEEGEAGHARAISSRSTSPLVRR